MQSSKYSNGLKSQVGNGRRRCGDGGFYILGKFGCPFNLDFLIFRDLHDLFFFPKYKSNLHDLGRTKERNILLWGLCFPACGSLFGAMVSVASRDFLSPIPS